MSHFQSRLGALHDRLKAKLYDNALRLAGSRIDFLRVRILRDKFGDQVSRRVEAHDLIDVYLPKAKELPIRRVSDYYSRVTQKVNLVPTEDDKTPIEVYIPLKHSVWQDDLLVKVFLPVNPEDKENTYILPLQVKEVLGSFGERGVVLKKYLCTLFDEEITEQTDRLFQDLVALAARRVEW